jgi:maltose-binding protein MalE
VGYPLGFKTTFLAYNSAYIDEKVDFNIKEIMDYADNVEFEGTENGLHIEKIFSCNLSDLFVNYGYVGGGIEIGGTFGSDVNDFSVSNSSTIRAVNNYLDLIEFFSIDVDKKYEDVVKDFTGGKNVFAIMSTDSLTELEKVEGMEYVYCEFPDYNDSDKTAPLAVTSAVAVNPYSDTGVMSEKFAKYVAVTMADELYKTTGILSANSKVTMANKEYAGIYESYMKSDNKNKYQYGDQVYPLIEIALHNIIAGEDVEDELQSVDAYMKKQLK